MTASVARRVEAAVGTTGEAWEAQLKHHASDHGGAAEGESHNNYPPEVSGGNIQ